MVHLIVLDELYNVMKQMKNDDIGLIVDENDIELEQKEKENRED